ncbi:hypothetical protein [Pseudarthrobacter sp. L1SW]|uniref:hypothetical protein n=1 Tax=Pseudarthrobacter sp. L1SW TaxID=2851598 RepID=UPI001E499764|nr:hypothetical protein [Pseudarthrobacter sp. L1SW]UEL27797.1 hypothetical protein KTR40_14550 [Pseudarthrobacter sp. L1SW]
MSEVLNAKVSGGKAHGVSRRRVIAGVAWTVPVIATAIAAPAAAASGLSTTAALVGAGSAITFTSSTATGSGTNHTGTGPTGFQIVNSGAAFTGAITGTINIKPTGTVTAGVGVQSITSATLTSPSYTAAHDFNATFTYAGGLTAGQTLNFPVSFQYERVTPAPSKVTCSYTLTITLRLPDGTDRILTGTLTVAY